MNFDINLPSEHTYTSGDIYTNDQGISWLIVFLYGDGRACCSLTGSSDLRIKLKFDQTSDNFKAISLVNNEFVLTDANNKATYCGLIFPATKDENNNVVSVVATGETSYEHRAYLLPLR